MNALREGGRTRAAALLLALLLAAPATAQAFPWQRIVWYVPNRALDVLDIVRARVRAGPGMAISLRATEAGDLYMGSYLSVYAGLPGPRGRRLPRLPAGVEQKTGVEASLADATLEAGLGPDYGFFEVGFGGQAAVLGFDVGIDPFEILDLAAGIVFLDPAGDDF